MFFFFFFFFFFFLMIRRPPRSTLFPTRRSSDLAEPDRLRRLGLEQAARFSWDRTAAGVVAVDRKSTRLNSSHGSSSYAVFCLKKKKKKKAAHTTNKEKKSSSI